jgi:hypothetical protein
MVVLGTLAVVSCDPVGFEPRSPYLPVALPAFSIQPGTTDATSCDSGVAFLASKHLTSFQVDVFQPDSVNPRQQCGGIAFDEVSPAVGGVEIHQSVEAISVGIWESWARRLRAALTGDLAADTFLAVKQITPDDTVPLGDPFEFDAPAEYANDLIYFAWRHAATAAEAVDTTTEVNAAAQLWRIITAPDSFAVDSVDETHVLVRWANRHRDRSIDSTQLYRDAGAGWQYDTTVNRATNQLTRTVTTWGTYRWIAQHVTAYLAPPDVPLLAQPNSAFTGADSVTFDPPPPTGLCEGNFAPTMDCRWWNAVANAPSEVLRDSVIQDTLPGGAINHLVEWTDSAVTADSTYPYQVRHLVGGLTGRLSTPPESAVASPVAPENLNCAGTGETTISCVWVDKEPDTVAVERKVKGGDWTPLTTVLAGVMYLDDEGLPPKQHCYRVRHRRGAAVTDWSNQECAVPGDNDPLRPEP